MRKMNATKIAEIHSDSTGPRPVSLEEYRNAQEANDQRLDIIAAILRELRDSC